MSLSKQDTDTIQEIVDKDGDCLDSKRCCRCPFRAKCLPEFLNPDVPSKTQRLEYAINVLAFHSLLDDSDV